jgi:methionyl-tRNA formyltransferase
MNEFIDDGPILYQHKFENIGQNSREVMEACNSHIAHKLSQILSDFINLKIIPIQQNRNEATWVCKRNFDDCIIDFDQTIDFQSLFFRALVEPYPLPRIKTEKFCVEILKSELVESDFYMTNGRVVNIERNKVWIKIANGFLIVSEIRDCISKSCVDVNDIFKIGMRLK